MAEEIEGQEPRRCADDWCGRQSAALEDWGEALMAQNRSDLALVKFAQAEKYAPNWGRLHLKWGEALGYAGHNDEARKQFQIAATLDMSAADEAELAKANAHG